jgi:hypothetical protein
MDSPPSLATAHVLLFALPIRQLLPFPNVDRFKYIPAGRVEENVLAWFLSVLEICEQWVSRHAIRKCTKQCIGTTH